MKIKNTACFLILFIILLNIIAVPPAFTAEENIHIAVASPLSGKWIRFGNFFYHGVKLYIDQVNNAGGINGKPIIIDLFDDQNNADKARQNALKIASENQALAVIGHNFSSCSIQAGEIYKKHKIPAITPTSTNDKVTENNDWYFRTIFTDRFQGQFLANYAIKILKYNTVSIIYTEETYGTYLKDVFTKEAESLGADIQYIRSFSTNDENLEQTLKKIVKGFEFVWKPGVIFLAMHAEEGSKVVKQLKDQNIKNLILTPDSFASDTFTKGFESLAKEKSSPGYYASDTYVATPLIYEIANSKAQKFKKDYESAFGVEPSWGAAYSYDAAMLIVEAMKKAGIQGTQKSIKKDRKKIRDYLAFLDEPDKAIQGITGINYFDENGNPFKPIFIGTYKNNNVISAIIQLKTDTGFGEIFDLDEAVKSGYKLKIIGKYFNKTNVVYTGIHINEIKNINSRDLTFEMDFLLWFRFHGDFKPNDIIFTNTADPISLKSPIQTFTKAGITYKLFHVKGKFKSNTFQNTYTYGRHMLGVSFHHSSLSLDHLIFVVDKLGMDRKNNEILEKMKKSQVLGPGAGCSINDFVIFQDTSEKQALGNPKFLNAKGGFVNFSRFNFGVGIRENTLTLRGGIPYKYTRIFFIISLLIFCITGIVQQIKKSRHFFKTLFLFLKLILVSIILISGEMLIMEWLQASLNVYCRKITAMSFDILWWIIPAIFAVKAVEQFVWMPLERKTGNEIPKFLRRFIAFLILLFACFGIIAFVFDQKITSLLATSGVVAMIIGLAVQMNISNIFSGIALNLERPFRIGDWVQVGSSNEGQVINTTWRTTRIRTRENSVLSIPNSTVAESIVNNLSYPEKNYELSFTVYVDPAHRPDRVKKILLDAALSVKNVLLSPYPRVLYKGINENMILSESWAAQFVIILSIRNYSLKSAYHDAVWESIRANLNSADIASVTRNQKVYMLKNELEKTARKSQPVNYLDEIEIFQPFSQEIKKSIAQKMQLRSFSQDQIIFRQGCLQNSLFIITEGVVSVEIKGKTGKNIEVGRMGVGNFFGEVALITGLPRSATVRALTKTHLLEIGKKDLLPFIEKEPEVSRRINKILSSRKHDTDSQKKAVALAEKNIGKKDYLKKFLSIFSRRKQNRSQIKSDYQVEVAVKFEDELMANGILNDISLSGLSFFSSDKINPLPQKGASIIVDILPGDKIQKSISVSGTLIYINEIADKSQMRYGIEFDILSKDQIQQIKILKDAVAINEKIIEDK